MFGIGIGELLIIFVVALLFLGPDKLPEVARQLAKVFGEFRRASDDLRLNVMGAGNHLEVKPALGNIIKRSDVIEVLTSVEPAAVKPQNETSANG